MSNQIEEAKPEYTFDLTTIEPGRIANLYQEGNYLVGITEAGVRFRQRIPTGKILTMVNGEYILQDMIISEVAK